MIDIHSHILPDVDDGSRSWEETLAMITIAERDEITVIAATPHMNPSHHAVEANTVLDLVEETSERIRSEGHSIQVVAGHDAHLVPELLSQLQTKKTLTLNSGRYFLLEPPEHFESKEIQTAVFSFMTSGYIPIITHPERLGTFIRHPNLIPKLIRQGALIQITAGSITGYFGEKVQEFSEHLLRSNLVHVVASDAHSPRHRPPVLSLARDQIRRMGLDPEPLVHTNPKMILNNQDLDVYIPEVEEGKKSSLLHRLFGK